MLLRAPLIALWNEANFHNPLKQWFSTGVIVPPRVRLVMSGDIRCCLNWESAVDI